VKGEPKSLANLARHNSIEYRLRGSGRLYEWRVAENGQEMRVAPPSSVVVTDAASARDLALVGVGIAYLSEPSVRDDLRAGRLSGWRPISSVTRMACSCISRAARRWLQNCAPSSTP